MEHLANDQALEHMRLVAKEEFKRRFVTRREFDILFRSYLKEREQVADEMLDFFIRYPMPDLFQVIRWKELSPATRR